VRPRPGTLALGAVPAAMVRQAHLVRACWIDIARCDLSSSPHVSHEGVDLYMHWKEGLRSLTGSLQDRYREEPLFTDFLARPEVVRTVVESERLAYGHILNPAFATEISQIDPLPHQRIAVYGHMLQQARLRFLLADDAGAGKTIMAGLYLREMLSRRLIARVLIVPPAGLVGNWERELRTLFNVPSRIITGADSRNGNPFTTEQSGIVIVSIDTLAGERMFACLQEAEVTPYDLVIFDEAHKLSADREADLSMRRTDRYRVAEALAGLPTEAGRWSLSWSCRHVLLLTATPHMGREFPYYCLWRLLEPEALSTLDAFHAYPPDARQRHFLRRTKEELVSFEGQPLYPPRFPDTLSYELSGGEDGEQELYDTTTRYIATGYNRARLLNRSAARLAMSVFQRRLASSTYALLRSFERRAEKLEALLADMRAGRLGPQKLVEIQYRLDRLKEMLDESTADEEGEGTAGEEAHERNEADILGAVLASSLTDLETELAQVHTLLALARRVHAAGRESKFEKLRDVLEDPRYQREKLLIFTEHRDTLFFLVQRLQGLGFTDQIAQIHGGMSYQEREVQVAAFRKPIEEGGALYMVATDAAGEGINLQVCWLMINYDLPWNPARLEQRMGRLHRYGQRHAEVRILNLISGSTREGRVLRTLLKKLEDIRKELSSDKVFDVIGRLFEGVSLRDYMEQVALTDNESEVTQRIAGKLTREQISALQEREKTLSGESGAVRRELPRLRATLEQEVYRRLLPGYVRHFVEHAAPLLALGLEGDLAGIFALRPLQSGAVDWLLPVLETYALAVRDRYILQAPRNGEQAIFLHPGERVFERLRAQISMRFAAQALQGAVFIDPMARRPYLYHLIQIMVKREADPALPPLEHTEVCEYRLIGLRQEENGEIERCPAEHLLLLRGSEGLPASTIALAAAFERLRPSARDFALARGAQPLAEAHRQRLLTSLPERQRFLEHGFDYQMAELAEIRHRLTGKANAGSSHAKGELTKIKNQQRSLQVRKASALAVLGREPELIVPGEITFLAHALIVPSQDQQDHQRYAVDVEAIAVQVVRAYEEARGASVRDVSTAERALAVGLEAWPGFDLLSRQPSGAEIAIEVKGRADIGSVELTENEYIRACNLRDRYWLYVVYECAKMAPRLLRVQDPFGKLIVRAKSTVVIDEGQIFAFAESE